MATATRERDRTGARPRASLALAVLVASALGGCLDHELPPDQAGAGGNGGHVFIAQQRDFADFEDWIAFETDVPGAHGELAGKISEYLNEMPAPDAEEFPIGTIVVKVVVPERGTAPAVHAMAKRGGTFNRAGAFGWEFFELQQNAKGVWIIAWRGTRPPTGEDYKNLLADNQDDGTEEADCNGCHVVSHNDAILSAKLDLTTLP